MGFSELVKSAHEHAREARKRIDVDVSRFVGKPDGSEIVVLREPDVRTIHRSGEQAKILKSMHPDWPESLCGQVTMLALCHVSPPEDETPIGIVYAEMADVNGDMFMFLSNELDRACPELARMSEEVAKRKAGEALTSDSVFSASAASGDILSK